MVVLQVRASGCRDARGISNRPPHLLQIPLIPSTVRDRRTLVGGLNRASERFRITSRLLDPLQLFLKIAILPSRDTRLPGGGGGGEGEE